MTDTARLADEMTIHLDDARFAEDGGELVLRHTRQLSADPA